MPWWINEALNWFWYYRRGKVRYHVWNDGDTFNASAHNGKLSVWNFYGGTPEAAKEMALYRLNGALAAEPKEKEIVFKGEGYALYRNKDL